MSFAGLPTIFLHKNTRRRRSDMVKRGFVRTPHRSLLRATGAIRSDADFDKPFIGVCNSYIDLIPGHAHLQKFGSIVKEEIRATGVIETNFKDETETDLFGEQAVLCGGAEALIRAGFETLTEAGYPEELAYFECMHELKLIVDLFYEGGLAKMNTSVSDTAEYGGYSRGSRVIGNGVKAEMKKILSEVQSGQFAREWIEECDKGWPNMNSLRSASVNHPIEAVGKRLRGMMSWL